jgi:putative hydrolase of the HAD superfamily
MVIDAVLFDLDDTLFDQRAWLDGAWRAVAAAAWRQGVDAVPLLHALQAVCAEGSERGRIIDRALARIGATGVAVGPLVDAFRSHRPPELPLHAGVVPALARLGAAVPLALVTDGDPIVQRGKVEALGLDGVFDVVVLSDELGRARRKPHPAPFLRALDALGVPAAAAVHIGDRPDKDVAGANLVGMRAVRVRTGEYRQVKGDERPWREAPDAVAAMAIVENERAPLAGVGAGAASAARDRWAR